MAIIKKPEPQPDLLTAREVARRLSIGVRTVWRLVQLGEIPEPIRFGKRLSRWAREDIEQFVARRRQSPDNQEEGIE